MFFHEKRKPMQVLPGAELAVSSEQLLPVVRSALPNCLVGDNFDQVPDPVLIEARGTIYAPRSVRHVAVDLLKYPPGTRLFGGPQFLLECDGVLVAEQVPNQFTEAAYAAATGPHAMPHEPIAVDEPCLLVSRYGLMVWGHWFGELMPRIMLTEAMFPGRFRYVLPPAILNPSSPRNVFNSILETIDMLGVTPERLLILPQNRDYVFANLYGVTPVYANSRFHPEALALLRRAYRCDAAVPAGRRIAILRTESKSRNIANVEEVIHALRRRRFEFVEIGTIPFREQVHLFSTARTIAGVLASGLTGLFFSPDKVQVLSMAPQGYLNRFFYGIMQQRAASYYDIRGPMVNHHPGGALFSNFTIDIESLEAGLDRLEQIEAA